MKNSQRKRNRFLSLGLGCTIFINYFFFASPSIGQSSLELTIEVENKNPLHGEPVYLTVRLKNNGTQQVKLVKNLRPEDGLLNLTLTRPDRQVINFVPLYILDRLDTLEILEPDSVIANVFPIFYGAQGWTFRETGPYIVTAEYQIRANQEPVRSVPLNIDVKSGDGAGDFLLQDGIANQQAGKFLLWQSGDHLSSGIAHLEELIIRFPNSPLSDYIRVAFGRNLSSSFKNYIVGEVRPPQSQDALDMLGSVITQSLLPTLLIIQKKIAEAKSYFRLDDKVSARFRLEEARRLARTGPEFGEFSRQLNGLEEIIGKPGDTPQGDEDSQK